MVQQGICDNFADNQSRLRRHGITVAGIQSHIRATMVANGTGLIAPDAVARRCRRDFQKTALLLWSALVRPSTPVLEGALDVKLRAWRLPTLPGRRARRAVQRLQLLQHRAPPRCHFAMLRTLCDGWITQRRFGDRHTRCLAGCGGEDSMSHYACCPLLKDLARNQLGLQMASTPPQMLEDFMALTPGSTTEEVVARALWTGAVYKWHGLARHHLRQLAPAARVEALAHVLRDLRAGTRTTL